MTKIQNIIIVGATGLVGQEFIKLLKSDIFIMGNFNIKLTSQNYVGLTCKETGIKYISMNDINYNIPSIFINCANNEQALLISKNILDHSIMIDNSSEFRMNENVPLIIPEINFDSIDDKNIIANPNCSTIILSMLLYPFIKNNYKIKRIVVSTYQAASGAGKDGLDELIKQTKQIVDNNPLSIDYWKQQYIYNCFVHNSSIENNDYCQEENKLINETNKIFNMNIPMSPTCIRVPVLRSHCESVNIEFYDEIDYEQIYKLLDNEKHILHIIDYKNGHVFPTSISSNSHHIVEVGHIRQDLSLPKNKGWNFWISGDQLLRGAAYNAYLIMQKIILVKF
jgi:aspartate-semialdehyde dehydrogenase